MYVYQLSIKIKEKETFLVQQLIVAYVYLYLIKVNRREIYWNNEREMTFGPKIELVEKKHKI